MIKIKNLAKNITVSDVTGYKFKNENEILCLAAEVAAQSQELYEKFLKQLKKVNYAEIAGGIVRVKRDGGGPVLDEDIDLSKAHSLKDVFETLEALHEKEEIMEKIEHQLHGLYGTSPRNSLVKELKEHKEKLANEIRKIETQFSKHAVDSMPAKFSAICSAIYKYLDVETEQRTTGIGSQAMMTPHEDEAGRLHVFFTFYICLEDFVDDEEEHTYPQYYVVLTCTIDPARKMSYHLNTLHKYRLPGSFNPGHVITDKASAMKVLENYLSIDHFSSMIERSVINVKNLKVTRNKLYNSGKFIDEVKDKDENTLRFKINPEVDEAELDTIRQHLLADLRSIISLHSNARIEVVLVKTGRTFAFDVKFIKPQKESDGVNKSQTLTSHQLDLLKETFGLDDKQVHLVQRAIHKGY